jgi:DNA-binding FrmR family transcriptional regulator
MSGRITSSTEPSPGAAASAEPGEEQQHEAGAVAVAASWIMRLVRWMSYPSPQGVGTRAGRRRPEMQADTSELDARLASIEGHIKGIRRMLQEDTYCVDVLKQTFAVERALQKFEAELLRGHLATCVPTGFKEGRNEKMVEELTDLFALARK